MTKSEELAQFVRDFLAGKIFVSAQVDRHEDIPLVFLPVALGGVQGYSPEEREKHRKVVEECLPPVKDPNDARERDGRKRIVDLAVDHLFPLIGVLYEYKTEAIPGRGVNGYPIFTSCRILSPGDWKRACAAIKREQARTIEV